MASRHATIADAVTAYLTGLTLSQAFVAHRAKVPSFALELCRTLRVDVVLGKVTRKRVSRGGLADKTFAVEIVVQGSLDLSNNTSTADLDAYVQLCEEIESALENQTMGGVTLQDTSRENVYDETMADNSHHFAAILTATYREIA